MIGNFLVFAEDRSTFKAAVDASDGDSLVDVGTFDDVAPAPEAASSTSTSTSAA